MNTKKVYFCLKEQPNVFLKTQETAIYDFKVLHEHGPVQVIRFLILSSTIRVDLCKSDDGVKAMVKDFLGLGNYTSLQDNLNTLDQENFFFVHEKKFHAAVQALFYVKYVIQDNENLFWNMYNFSPSTSSQDEEQCKKVLEELEKMSLDARYLMGLLVVERIFSLSTAHKCLDPQAVAVKICSESIVTAAANSPRLSEKIANSFVKPLITKYYNSGFWISTFAVSTQWSYCCDMSRITLAKDVLFEKFKHVSGHELVSQQRLLVERISDVDILLLAFEVFDLLQDFLFGKFSTAVTAFQNSFPLLQLAKRTQIPQHCNECFHLDYQRGIPCQLPSQIIYYCSED